MVSHLMSTLLNGFLLKVLQFIRKYKNYLISIKNIIRLLKNLNSKWLICNIIMVSQVQSKYDVMDRYENVTVQLQRQISQKISKQTFELEYPENTNKVLFECYLDQQCIVPDITNKIYLKIFNSGGKRLDPFKLFLPFGKYDAAQNQIYETTCFCHVLPCSCTLYIYMELYTYNFVILTHTYFKALEFIPSQKSLI